MHARPVIAFLTGGYSGEAEISYLSAKTIEKNIDPARYEVFKIDIRKDGWVYTHTNGKVYFIDKNDFSLLIDGVPVYFDAVLIGIHGTPGEDGKLQGYFDMLGIPYTSCDAATSALTFNKRYTVAVAAFAGIHVARSLHLFKDRKIAVDEIAATLQFPVFVKPNNGGSSIGMSKVNAADGLAAALDKAFHEDDQVLVEEFIAGREFTIGVFRSQGKIITLPFTEIIAKNEFFDFEAKYHGKSEEITPAVVDEAVAEKVRAAARQVYEVFNCRGVVRIDFIYNEAKGAPYMLEINTVPGQSEASIVPQQVRAMKWTLQDFYSALIDDALALK
ncbi:D-alanine--D-alanine ligase [Flavihumibacter fluvii]|uniref:D-alanine--D-alanine ligase n=1 Tax=Flavihumibacter fluvii TaxID=2838157 RepID=UPI001BDF4325|nr:D-alanine--D-alanine ligase [Flavihumibacter fluvii]ULQ52904.1 D-alanine--D-alanine ligase [Flavihumibacter fluvii]